MSVAHRARAGAGLAPARSSPLRPRHALVDAVGRRAWYPARAAAADAAFGDGDERAAAGGEQQQQRAPPGDAAAAAERRRLWMAAIKPPMYSVGILPVLVGGEWGCRAAAAPAVCGHAPQVSAAQRAGAQPAPPLARPLPPPQVGAAAAFGECGALAWGRCAALIGGAVCVIAWLNLRWGPRWQKAKGRGAAQPPARACGPRAHAPARAHAAARAARPRVQQRRV